MQLKPILANYGIPVYTLTTIVLIVFIFSNCNHHSNSNTEINIATSNDSTIIHVIDFKTPSPKKGSKEVYDTIAHFPKDGEWRKILMIQTIKCDESTTKDKNPCGEWDYITNTVIFNDNTQNSEKIEINSFITPYGNGLNLTDAGWEYVWDVTDYAPILKGDKRIEHGNNQELHDLKFIFLKGKPNRSILKIENVWPTGIYQYKDLALNNSLKHQKIPLLKDGKSFHLKSRISGHGHAGPYNCCEWDEKMHSYRFGKEAFINWSVWKDCGHNPIHPQGGTWQFDRAGWCPGTATDVYQFDVTKYVKNDSLAVDYQIEMFDDNGEEKGQFRMAHQLVTYGNPNFNIDASIIEAKAPNNALRYRRTVVANDGTPVLKIKNEGAQILRTISFTYGVKGKITKKYTWHGVLDFLEEQDIILPQIDMTELKDTETFFARINTVNNMVDEQPLNNSIESTWDLPIYFPEKTILKVKTNNLGRAYENSYVLLDQNGRVIKERKEFPENTTFNDTLQLKSGTYTWMIKDLKQDGMIRHWWNRGEREAEIGINGSIEFTNIKGNLIAKPPFDFADYYSFSFRVK